MVTQPDFKELLGLFNAHRVEFVKNKRASGRHRDLADLEALGEA
jgi:hypothetical protein